MGNTCLVVMYHYVRDSATTPFPEIRALPPALIERQLDWLQREHHLISLHELEAAMDGHARLPPNAALVTFDDGFIDHYEAVFPILRRRGVSGVFFLAQRPYEASPRVLGVHKTHFLLAHLGAEAFAAAVLREHEPALVAVDAGREDVFGADRWEHADERTIKHLLNYGLPFDEAERILDALFARHLGPQESFARELYLGEPMIAGMAAAGMTFGYHTRSHRMLSRLDVEEQERELRDGVAWIRRLTGQARVSFCYPWGGPKTYTTGTVQILAGNGYSVAFTSVRRRVDLSRDGRFELPRIDARDLPPYVTGEPATPPGEPS
ncbi:MAG: polysaccharide deacetylase family protein [Acidobacteria bacterium]|nr:polysaccharide deacetylase family protein [Acidobacteriota bacterium]